MNSMTNENAPQIEGDSAVLDAEAVIPSYMSAAVLATILCFPFTGAAAIVYAGQVRTRLEDGDRAGAAVASKKARRMVWLSLVCGAIMIVLTVTVGLAVALYFAYMLETP